VLLAASLAVMVLLTGRIALVEFPAIAPIFADNILVPRPYQFVAAAVLVLLLVSVIARRWPEPPPVVSSAGGGSWRRDEGRYHHERRILVWLLAAVALAEGRGLILAIFEQWNWRPNWFSWETLDCFFDSSVGCLSLALIILAVQGMFSGWSKRPDAVATARSRLAPMLFLLVWSVMLTIVVCGAPILGAWGFALWLRLG
jgi:hypothetical protein